MEDPGGGVRDGKEEGTHVPFVVLALFLEVGGGEREELVPEELEARGGGEEEDAVGLGEGRSTTDAIDASTSRT